MVISKMGLKVLHYVFNALPFSSGYALRTHSIVKTQSKHGLLPAVAISVNSLIGNYFTKLKIAPKNVIDGIYYYSAHNELMNDLGFKLSSKFLMKNNRVTRHLRRKFYALHNQKILSNYYKFILSEIGNIDLIHAHAPSIA